MTPRLHMKILGPTDAPIIVCLHGFLGCGADWAELMQHVVRPFRWVMIDLPGHGQSRDLPPEAYTWEGAIRCVIQSVKSLGYAPVSLLGYSMGGRLALYCALRFPHLFRRVLLESASPGLAVPGDREARIAQDETWARRFETEPAETVLSDWYGQPVFASLSPAQRQALVETRLEGSGLERARALRGLGLGQQPDVAWELERLPVPLRCLAGEQDAKFVTWAHRMAALPDEGDAVIVPGAGHLVHIEQARCFAREIATFFRANNA